MGRNWAIVVGINHYENLRSLNFAKRDASVMATWFQQVHLLQFWFSCSLWGWEYSSVALDTLRMKQPWGRWRSRIFDDALAYVQG
jgi:hypothetical protein